MPDHKSEESFKVIDRRLFTAEGELRKEALDHENREGEAAATQKSSATRSSASTSTAKAPASSPAATGTPPPAPAAEAPPSSRGFQMLVDFLARNAAALLGGFADPRTGQAILDLEGAREMIDMLDALREKTRSNLSPEDDHLLIEVLGSLKLSFLEMSKAAAQAMKEKAKSKT